MSVVRIDLNKCVGCESCAGVCPMDVFYFDCSAHKSVLAYPENCQSCGQCVVNCKGRSIGISNDSYGYPITAYRGATSAPMNRTVVTDTGVITEFTKGKLPSQEE